MCSENNYIVYKHTAPNGKVYIGITGFDPEYRWLNNGRGYKNQTTFFNAIIKYGWINFTHEILYTDLTKEEALDIEESLIQKYKSYDRRFGYNISLRGAKFGEHIQERKQKRLPISEIPTWKNRGTIIHKKAFNGSILKTYRSVHELALELNTPIETLRTRLKKYKKLQYDDCYYEIANAQTPKVEMLTLTDELLKTFSSLTEAYKYINRVNKGHITRVCCGKDVSYLGYKWRFKYEN